MNWDDVRYFLALCREGSVSQAGKALGVNHTTVARRIGALEDELGTRLFDRTRDGYAMTQAAENMYEKALDMESYALAIDRAMYGQDAELSGPLKLTAPYDFANRVIVPALPRFRDRYPCIELQLLTTTGLVDLAAREADIAVRLTAKPPEYLVGREVLPLKHGIYGAPTYVTSMPKRPDVILFRSEQVMPEWAEQHYPNANVALKTDNLTTMRAAVAAGLGLARMPCFEGDSEPGIRRIDEPLAPSTWGVWILSHVDLRSTARVRVCREFLAEIILDKSDLILGNKSRYFK
ncbi:MAG: LysR family transcriptional regulator [Woeseiaceae bacterium]|nr:LysR family transcriptional regulator [Woeseiaceae bacterium]